MSVKSDVLERMNSDEFALHVRDYGLSLKWQKRSGFVVALVRPLNRQLGMRLVPAHFVAQLSDKRA
jgi:hypothetical protein